MEHPLSEYGFLRTAAALPRVKPGAVEFNTRESLKLMRRAAEKGVAVAVFPELGLSGYTCADLFQQEQLLRGTDAAVVELIVASGEIAGIFVLGAPVRKGGRLFNCALVIAAGTLHGIVPKTIIPNFREFYEARWFASGKDEIGPGRQVDFAGHRVPFGRDLLFSLPIASRSKGPREFRFGIEICEDLWAITPPSSGLAAAGAELILNPSASNELVGKAEYRKELVRQQSARTLTAYVYASAGTGESTTDTVFGGHGLIAENGTLIAESERFRREEQLLIGDIDLAFIDHERINSTTFSAAESLLPYREVAIEATTPQGGRSELVRPLGRNPFVPAESGDLEARCREIFAIQSAGLASRLAHIGCSTAIIGLSGGLDSTLALLVTVEAFRELGLDTAGIKSYTLPGFGTSARTRGNVEKLTEAMGLSLETVDIGPASLRQLEDLNHSGKPEDTAYENVQARQRTMFLMNKANMEGGIVIGTGDLSELALGWCTYNGDHMSMYAVNTGVPKTLVKFLVTYVAESWAGPEAAEILLDIVDTPISPELLPPDARGNIAQKTEDTIGPYELHDFFLYHAIRAGAEPAKVLFLAEQAFRGEYSRETLLTWLKSFYRRFFSQQFKRSCLPDGPKVGTISLSPRGDWRMPSDAAADLWLRELDRLS